MIRPGKQLGHSTSLACDKLGWQLGHSSGLACGKARKAAWTFYQFGMWPG